MKIRQPVINTFKRVGIDYEQYLNRTDKVEVANRFSGDTCMVHPLIAKLIEWVYQTSNDFESKMYLFHEGKKMPTVADFDRIRYFILEQDENAYMTCID